MGFLLSLQALERNDAEKGDAIFASVASVTLCRSTASITVC